MMNKTWNINFKKFLEENNINAKEASEKINIPYSTFISYTNGSRTPSDKSKEKICELGFNIYKEMYGDKCND